MPRPTSLTKRRAVLAAAEDAFLCGGFDSVKMDDIAEQSGVAKQTVYAYFGNKESLFRHLVTSMTTEAGDRVLVQLPKINDAGDLAPAIEELLCRQLGVVLTPRLIQLRRLVIGEVRRFPALAQSLAENGPLRAIQALAALLTDLDERGLLMVPDPEVAASQLNWLTMGEPVNNAMLLGDDAIPHQDEMREHVHSAVSIFLAAHGRPDAGT